ncbi:hypothetical protein P7K49_041025, partial [Saguinus oedipus]
LTKGTAEQSFTCISLYAGILLERPMNKCKAEQNERSVASLNKCKAEQSFTAISLYSGILIKRPLNKCKAEEIEGYVASLNKETAEHIEGYFASVFKAEQSFTAISQSFTVISQCAGILMKWPLNKGTAELIEGYLSSLNKCKAEQIEGYIASVGKAEHIEGYFASVFKAAFYCYFLNKGTAEQSFTGISLHAGILLERPLNKWKAEEQSFTAISQSFTAISLYAGILLERPLNKGTAEQSFTAISLHAGILLERPLNKGTAEQIEEYLNKRTAEQIEGYVCSVFKAEFYCYFLNKGTAEQSFTAISLYVGILLEKPAEFYCYFVICGNTAVNACLRSLHTKRFHTPLSTHVFYSLNKGTAEQIEVYFPSVFKEEFYCYFAVCGNTAGKGCFEISLPKAFPDFQHRNLTLQSFTAISLYAGILLERAVLRSLHRKRFQTSPSTNEFNSAEFYCYFVICGNTAVKPCLRSLHTKRFHTSPSTHEFNSLNKGTAEQTEGYVSSVFKAEFYCYFVICKNTAGKACFEISLQKAFPDFPFNTRV